MRRLIALFLLMLLTLQAPWAVAAAYCQHERAPETQHFGHHVHEHGGAHGVADAEASDTAPDLDCPACHACTAVASLHSPSPALATAGGAPPGHAQRLLPAPPPTALDRPDWHHLA